MPDGNQSPTTGTRTYLSFDVAGEGHALPLGMVREILRVPPLVRVPQGPASLEGLGNLRGRVLPVVSLAGLLGRPPGDRTASARVLVLDRATLLGLRVDAVWGLVTVGQDRVEEEGGVLRMKGGDLRVVDPMPLLAAEFRPQPRGLRSGPVPAVADGRGDGKTPAGQVGLIGFELAGREYALPIDGVREVLSLPTDLAVLPGSDDASFGVATVRGGTLPILSGRALLGLPTEGQGRGADRVIVVPLERGGFGVLVDRITAIHRTDAANLDPVPAILGRGPRPEAEVQAIARVGGRLIAVLSPDRLLGPERTGRILDMDSEAGETMTPVDEEAQAQQFILFRLGDTECAIPISSVEEVARVPDRFSTLPRAPSYVKGVMTLRGQALPVIDLRGRLDLPPVPQTGRERVLVLSSKSQRAGFVVDAVRDVARLPSSIIEPAPELADRRAMVVTQAANLAKAGRLILLIDAGRLLERTEMLAQDAPLP